MADTFLITVKATTSSSAQAKSASASFTLQLFNPCIDPSVQNTCLPSPSPDYIPESSAEPAVIFYDEWVGSIRNKTNEFQMGRPRPYIKELSPTGLLFIKWTDIMKPPEDIHVIPDALVALPLEADFNHSLRRVLARNETNFIARDGSKEQRMLTYKALEITVAEVGSEDSSEEE